MKRRFSTYVCAAVGLAVWISTLTVSSADDLRCSSRPTLYTKKNLGGRSLALNEGTILDLRTRGFNNKASAIAVPEGWVVTLWSGRNCRGRKAVYRGSSGGKTGCYVLDLRRTPRVRDHRGGTTIETGGNMDNKASSVEVRRE